jgi:hypothetical protein
MMRIACVVESSLWTRFLETSDMLLMANVDACTMKFYCRMFFLAVPIFASQETSDKIPTKALFLRKMVVLQETYLALGCWLACCFCFVSASYRRRRGIKHNQGTSTTH